MLYVTNQDKPGFIGRFGATLAGAGINIATFHLGRASQGGDAICLVSVDEEVPEAVLVDGAHPAAGGAGDRAGVLIDAGAAAASRTSSWICSARLIRWRVACSAASGCSMAA